MSKDQMITLRVSKTEEINKRVNALVPVIESLPEYKAFRVSRSVVLRLALLKGLEELEREHQQG